MNKIGVSIVTYNTNIELLKKCVHSISTSILNPIIYIVDNSPVRKLDSFCLQSNCHYDFTGSNLGYGSGHNRAIRRSINEVEYHLVINPDVWFCEDILTHLVSFLDKNPSVGQVMPRITYPDGRVQNLCKLVPYPQDLIIRRFFNTKLFQNLRDRFEVLNNCNDHPIFVPYLSGCFMLFRCSTLKDVGIFDERFFMYPEDIDLTRRIARQNDTVYFPYVTAIHAHAASSYKSKKMLYIHICNMIRYFNKWGWFFDKERSLLNKRAVREMTNDNYVWGDL